MVAVRSIAKIRKYIDQRTTEMLVNCLVTSRVDYCNALLCGVSMGCISKIQRIQNLCARIITKSTFDTSILKLQQSLHWLPVSAHIKYKSLLLAYKALNSGPRVLKRINNTIGRILKPDLSPE